LINSDIASVANQAADAAATIIKRYFADLASSETTEKTSAGQTQGLVTAADVESERAIIAIIRAAFPLHEFLAEENVDNIDQAKVTKAEHLWVIDPLDGTNNFAHGIPHFAVSIAYYVQGVAQYGLIRNVVTGDNYQCAKGQGAFENDSVVRCSSATEFSQCMIGVGFYYDRGEMMQATLKAIDSLFAHDIHGIRRFGTAALDLVQVATGRFGAFFEYTLSPWDFAAGRLFVEEAGGTVTTCSGDPLPLAMSSVLASNGHLHDPMLKIVSHYKPKN
jgi:myo-inositol-1(or 4)-monophosphatase